jgi:hypothetical protein
MWPLLPFLTPDSSTKKDERFSMPPERHAEWAANGRADAAVVIERGIDVYAVCTVETVWDGHTPTPALRVRELVAAEPELIILERLEEACTRARRARLRSFKKCQHCAKRFPPEHGSARDGCFSCHGCMERHEGVVF